MCCSLLAASIYGLSRECRENLNIRCMRKWFWIKQAARKPHNSCSPAVLPHPPKMRLFPAWESDQVILISCLNSCQTRKKHLVCVSRPVAVSKGGKTGQACYLESFLAFLTSTFLPTIILSKAPTHKMTSFHTIPLWFRFEFKSACST